MENISRHKFIKLLSDNLLTAGSLAFLSSCTRYTYITPQFCGNRLCVLKSNFLTTDFVLLTVAKYKKPIFLWKKDTNAFHAVVMECTHKGCELDPAGNLLVCPCHGSQFSREGQVLKSPAQRPLKTIEVSQDDEMIYLHV